MASPQMVVARVGEVRVIDAEGTNTDDFVDGGVPKVEMINVDK